MQLDWLILLNRLLHLVAVIVAIGGAMFMRIALLPAARSVLDNGAHERLREAVRARWARVVHVSIVVLFVTGAVNFVVLALPPKIEPMPYHAIFGVKFLIVLGIFFLASVLVGRSEGLAHIRRDAGKWLSVLLVLAVLVIFISGILSQVRQRQAVQIAPQENRMAEERE